MSSYTVRVELHSGNYSDFISLHSEMEGRGFRRLITSGEGVTYHLPRAEYDISTIRSRSEVLDLAKSSVAVTGKTAEILVTESAGRTWSGLTKVD